MAASIERNQGRVLDPTRAETSSAGTGTERHPAVGNSGSLCIGPWASCTGSGSTNF